MNLHRRHLKDSQRAMVAARLATLKLGDPGAQRRSGPYGPPLGTALSLEEAAELLNVSRRSVVRAQLIRRKGTPQEIEDAKQGNAAITTVVRQVRARVSKKSPTPKAKAGKNPELYQEKSEAEKLWQTLRLFLDLTKQVDKGKLVEIAICDDKRTGFMNARLQESVVWLQDLAHDWKSETSGRSAHTPLQFESKNSRKNKPPVIEGTYIEIT